jgi:hypothetical protein
MSAILFQLGEIVLTPGAQDALEKSGQSAREFLLKHGSGEWNEMQQCDLDMNVTSVSNKGMIFSTYKLLDGTEINIKTDAGHKVTTVYLPGED